MAEATLHAWQQQVAQIRQRRLERGGGHAGLGDPAQVHVKTGLEVMTAIRPRTAAEGERVSANE